MSQKTTSLDIQKGEGSRLDVARDFPMTLPHPIDTARHGEWVDGMSPAERPEINLASDMIISLSRYRTTTTLDLALREVIDPALWQRGLVGLAPRPRVLDIVDPLSIPYGAVDVRNIEQNPPGSPLDRGVEKKTYPDLFARKLPKGLLMRRMLKGIRQFFVIHSRQILLSVGGVLVFSLPMLAYVAYAIPHGYMTLQSLVTMRDPLQIRDQIHRVRGDFERSSFLWTPFAWIPISQVETVDHAIAGGLALSRGLDIVVGTLPIQAVTGSLVQKENTDPLSYRGTARDISPLRVFGIENPTEYLKANQKILQSANSEFVRAGVEYIQIEPTGERTRELQSIGQVITRLTHLSSEILNHQDQILTMLGSTNPQRYIVFNQNRDEIRANGGFPGSILSFTLYQGNILDYRSDDVYYYDWNLYPYKEIPPPGIALLTGNYGLRDVNYYPDFRDTLEKANNFIERSGDASVTTGIAIHQGLIEDILAKVGPVSVSGVILPFTSDNFSLLMSTLVENKYGKDKTPKDILFQFGSALLTQIQRKNAYLDVLDILERYQQNGEFLIASRDPSIDAFLSQYRKELPWECGARHSELAKNPVDGSFVPQSLSRAKRGNDRNITTPNTCSSNWIYPVWTSVSGNKSDRYISRTYDATVKKIKDCRYQNTITIGTRHNFAESDRGELESYFQTFGITDPLEQARLRFIQGDGKNKSYLRVYVPLGSTLVGSGSDIIQVNNQSATVFALMIETPVGASSTKTWSYTLDIPACESYDGSVEWTRQPGLREVKVKK